MRTPLGLVVLFALASGCKKESPAPAPAPAPAEVVDDPCQHIVQLSQVMKCILQPYTRDPGAGDEAAFRKALQQLRELAPPESNFNSGERPWFSIVDDMLSSRNYAAGCKECHARYRKAYERQFDGAPIPWDNAAR